MYQNKEEWQPTTNEQLAILEIARSFEQGRWDGCYKRVKDILELNTFVK